MPEAGEVLAWFLDERGITQETLAAYGVRIAPDGAVIFPYQAGGEKTRWGIPHGERRFAFTKGITPPLYESPSLGAEPYTFLVEGETDAMRLWQELNSADGVEVLALSGIEAWRPEFAARFGRAEKVWVILDNDMDYNVQGRVDNAWRSIRRDLGAKAHRVRLPADVKDICEFFSRYDIESLRTLCKRTPVGISRFTPLDLTKEPPAVEWLVEEMICKGDIHLLIGEPGIGKSWLTMALAVAIATPNSEYLGKRVLLDGRVLYLDEENPENLIFDRFRKLGMSDEAARNIRYLSNQGIRLDRTPENLIDEALDYEPTLIVLDSLTRIHTEEENNAGSMARVFNDGIRPLARDTGAAVVLIHHANKSDSNSSYRRSRGSGDITASVDAGFDVREVGTTTMSLANFKSRRHQSGETLNVIIRDTSEGGVELVGTAQLTAPF